MCGGGELLGRTLWCGDDLLDIRRVLPASTFCRAVPIYLLYAERVLKLQVLEGVRDPLAEAGWGGAVVRGHRALYGWHRMGWAQQQMLVLHTRTVGTTKTPA